MQFWTPERCKTLSTEVLLDNAKDFYAQAMRAKTTETIDRKLEIMTMIQAELLTRA